MSVALKSDHLAQPVESLVAKIEAFVRDVIIPYEKDPRNDGSVEAAEGGHGLSAAFIRELRDHAERAGLLSPHILADGSHRSHRETAQLFRAGGYSLLGSVALNIMAPDEGNMFLLAQVASPAQRQRFLEPLVQGRIRSAFFMTEPDGGAGSDPEMLKTRAERDGDDWVISGRKTFITGAEGAAFGIIMARTERGATMFLADLDTPGIHIERVLETIDTSMPGGHATIRLDGVRVPASQILGKPDEGFRYAQIRLAPARLTHCMRWWGAAKRAHDIATAYACERRAFGKPIIEHEGVGFMLADNLIELKQAELMIDWCAGVLDAGHSGTTESSMTKVAVSEAVFRIADRCVQVLGGIGVTRDTVVEQIFREVRAFRIYDGPSEVHRFSLARKIQRSVTGRR
jgi:acyl-CoA dehydrogenase